MRAKIEYDDAVREFEKIKTSTEAQIGALRGETVPKECILSYKGLGIYSWVLIKEGKPESCPTSTPTVPNERGK